MPRCMVNSSGLKLSNKKTNNCMRRIIKLLPFPAMLILLLLVFIACDDTADEMSGRRFVRIEKVDISLNTGEKIILKAQVDSLSSLSKSFRWSVIDENIASIETLADNSGILTALAEGSTLVKVESTDG